MSPQPGRNDPCPGCSGRKFKHCCLDKADADDQARVNVRHDGGQALTPEIRVMLNWFDELRARVPVRWREPPSYCFS